MTASTAIHTTRRAYAAYKDSAIKWMGAIPEHWETVRIKYTTYVKGRVGWHGLNSSEFMDEGEFYLVTGTDFQGRVIQWDRCYRISEERYKEDPYIHVQEGDLLITKDGTIGKVAQAKGLKHRASVNSGIFVTRPLKSNTYVSDFMYYVLTSDVFLGFIEHEKSGTTINHLYQYVFSNFAFPLPPLPEQEAIARFLDHKTAQIDALIAKKEALLARLADKRTALISHAVTQGLDPTVPMRDSGIEWLGEIPEHWEVVRLKHISPLQTVGVVVNPSSYVEDDGEVPFFLGSDISEGHIDAEKARRISHESNRILSKSVLRQGDLVTVRVGAPGVTAVVPSEYEGSNCASVMIIRRSTSFHSHWLCYAMNSQVGRSNIELVQYGAAQKQFNISHAVDFWFPVPPLQEQVEITEYLDKVTTEIESLSGRVVAVIDKLKQYRTALITNAVTGKIDVRDGK